MELKAIRVETNGVNIMITTVYVPPHTSVWLEENHQKLIRETLKKLGVLQLSEKQCKKKKKSCYRGLDWKSFDPRTQPYSWNTKLLEDSNQYCLFQTLTDHTRVILGLISTRHKDCPKDNESTVFLMKK